MMYSPQDTIDEIEDFKRIADSLVELKAKKASDYGNSWRIFGLMGIVYQIGSKFIRIWNLTKQEGRANNEPLRDSFRDISVYGIMAMQILDGGNIDDAFSSFGSDKYREVDSIIAKKTIL